MVREAIWMTEHKVHSWNKIILENKSCKRNKVTEKYNHGQWKFNNASMTEEEEPAAERPFSSVRSGPKVPNLASVASLPADGVVCRDYCHRENGCHAYPHPRLG
jgi:hypothetical protein